MLPESGYVGAYRLLRQLGQGGMGAVYEAIQETIERRVAIKILRPEYASHAEITRRFFNEARAVNRIDHPGLVQIHEYGHLPEGTAYIVMELLKGETLAQRLRRLGGRVPAQLAIQLAWQIAAALTAAHDKEIFHRDLKPANLMLVPDPLGPNGERVKILDFGIAKLVEATCQEKTATSLVMGTPSYMSPEQCHGAGTVDGKTDVYSLGVILFEMLAGRPPFVSEGAGELLGMHLFKAPPSILELAPDVPPEIAAYTQLIIMNKDKLKRPSMREVLQYLTPLAEVRRIPLASSSIAASSQEVTRVIGSGPVPKRLEQIARPNPSDPIAGNKQAAATRYRSPRAAVILSSCALTILGLIGVLVASTHPRRTLKESAVPHTSVSSEAGRIADANVLNRPDLGLSATLERHVMEDKTADTIETASLDKKVSPVPPRQSGLKTLSGGKKPKQAGNNLLASSVTPAPTQPDSAAAKPDPVAAKDDQILRAAREEYTAGHYKEAVFWARLVTPRNAQLAWSIIGSAACKLNDLKLADEAMHILDSARGQILLGFCLTQGIEYRQGVFRRVP